VRSHSLIELEGGALGLLSSPNGVVHHSGIFGSNIYLHNNNEEEETSYPDHRIANAYSFNQIGSPEQFLKPLQSSPNTNDKGSHKKAKRNVKTPLFKKSPNVMSPTRADGPGASPGSKPLSHGSSPGKLNIQIPISGQDLHLLEERLNTAEDNNTKAGGGAVFSEHQSLDSSQYKTIKFQLMIMNQPHNKIQSNIAKKESVRLVGGRQSAKNFRKELKRYTMIDVVGGSPNTLKPDEQAFF